MRRQPFLLSLSGPDGELLRLEAGGLQLQLDRSGCLRELRVRAVIAANAVYGLGERFNSVDQMGKQVVISSEEKFTDQGGRSYLPIPFFFTDKGTGMLYEAGYESRYAFEPARDSSGFAAAELCFSCGGECENVLFFGPPADQLRQYLRRTGEPTLPPRWASSNRWETQQQVEEQLTALQSKRIPATVFVLERWSDDTTFDSFEETAHPLVRDGAGFDKARFRFEESRRWPDPCGLADRVHALGMKLLLWQAPILRRPPNASEQCRLDFQYAVDHRYCVMQPDGSPFQCPEGWFAGSLLIDFTNPEAVRWWMKKREWLLTQLHADGFKTDSGELVTDDRSLFYNGRTGRDMRNLYASVYEEAYADLLNRHCPDGLNFTRAGYTGAQKYPVHWTGDQRSTFAELRAQVRAALSAGLSGVLFMGTDLAGFAGELPTGELYRRGVCLAAFSGLMQFHSEPTEGKNNDRSPWNLSRTRHDPDLLRHYRRYANIRMCLLPYLYSEAINSAAVGRPLMAHLIIDYPSDPQARLQDDAYLLGRSLLTAPILDSGARGRQVYLPEGGWLQLNTGSVLGQGQHYISCSESEIPLFLQMGAILPLALPDSLSFGGDAPYGEKLCFLCAGEGSTVFRLSSRQCLTLSVTEGEAILTGDFPDSFTLLMLSGEVPSSVRLNGGSCHFRETDGSCFGRVVHGIQILRIS